MSGRDALMQMMMGMALLFFQDVLAYKELKSSDNSLKSRMKDDAVML